MNDNSDSQSDFEESFDDIDHYEDFETTAARGFTMRHPTLLILVIIGSAFMGYKTWPQASFYFAELTDCGALSERPHLKQTASDKLPPLAHDTYCTLDGTVHLMHALATAKKDGSQPGSQGGQLETMAQLAGVNYYVKLAGESLFAILPASRKDVHHHRVRQSSLFGFRVKESGRLFDPMVEPSTQATGRYLRLNFGIPDDQPILLFDVTQHPSDRWGFLVILILMGLTMCLAGYGLIRTLLQSRES
jgi:hypothetical protein